MQGKLWTGLLAGVCLGSVTTSARAFVSTPVGGRPGELDVNAQVTTERGKIEPNENQASWLPARDFYEYKLGVGYTWGDVGPLQFFSTRLEGTYYASPAERNDPSKWFLQAPGAGTSGVAGAGECTNGATYLGNGLCEFYPADKGTIASATVSFAVVHDPKFALGFFVRGSAPFGADFHKFFAPRFDYFAGGTQVGVELTSWLSYESSVFIGSGTRPINKEQNGVLALNNLFHFHADRWLLPWKAGFKIGPYVDGDINERYDARYDAAYSPVALDQPGGTPHQQNDRIRAARFALAMLPYFLVTKNVAVEAGYIQKFFGYDARGTQAWYLGLRGLVDLGPP